MVGARLPALHNTLKVGTHSKLQEQVPANAGDASYSQRLLQKE